MVAIHGSGGGIYIANMEGKWRTSFVLAGEVLARCMQFGGKWKTNYCRSVMLVVWFRAAVRLRAVERS